MKKAVFCLLVFFLASGACVYSEVSYDAFQMFKRAYEERGGDKYMIDEEIIQRSHVLQAAYIASTVGAPEDIVIGLLTHDIGQIIYPEFLGDIERLHEKHDEYGAGWLKARGFPDRMTNLVRYHTLVKVIFCEEIPEYYENLSQASKDSFHIQKKKYSSSEERRKMVETFKRDPYREEYKAARMCDEMAKLANFEAYNDDLREDRNAYFHPPGFDDYHSMFQRVLEGKGSEASDPNWILKIKFLYKEMIENRKKFEEVVRLGPDPLLSFCASFDSADSSSVGIVE